MAGLAAAEAARKAGTATPVASEAAPEPIAKVPAAVPSPPKRKKAAEPVTYGPEEPPPEAKDAENELRAPPDVREVRELERAFRASAEEANKPKHVSATLPKLDPAFRWKGGDEPLPPSISELGADLQAARKRSAAIQAEATRRATPTAEERAVEARIAEIDRLIDSGDEMLDETDIVGEQAQLRADLTRLRREREFVGDAVSAPVLTDALRGAAAVKPGDSIQATGAKQLFIEPLAEASQAYFPAAKKLTPAEEGVQARNVSGVDKKYPDALDVVKHVQDRSISGNALENNSDFIAEYTARYIKRHGGDDFARTGPDKEKIEAIEAAGKQEAVEAVVALYQNHIWPYPLAADNPYTGEWSDIAKAFVEPKRVMTRGGVVAVEEGTGEYILWRIGLPVSVLTEGFRVLYGGNAEIAKALRDDVDPATISKMIFHEAAVRRGSMVEMMSENPETLATWEREGADGKVWGAFALGMALDVFGPDFSYALRLLGAGGRAKKLSAALSRSQRVLREAAARGDSFVSGAKQARAAYTGDILAMVEEIRKTDPKLAAEIELRLKSNLGQTDIGRLALGRGGKVPSNFGDSSAYEVLREVQSASADAEQVWRDAKAATKQARGTDGYEAALKAEEDAAAQWASLRKETKKLRDTIELGPKHYDETLKAAGREALDSIADTQDDAARAAKRVRDVMPSPPEPERIDPAAVSAKHLGEVVEGGVLRKGVNAADVLALFRAFKGKAPKTLNRVAEGVVRLLDENAALAPVMRRIRTKNPKATAADIVRALSRMRPEGLAGVEARLQRVLDARNAARDLYLAKGLRGRAKDVVLAELAQELEDAHVALLDAKKRLAATSVTPSKAEPSLKPADVDLPAAMHVESRVEADLDERTIPSFRPAQAASDATPPRGAAPVRDGAPEVTATRKAADVVMSDNLADDAERSVAHRAEGVARSLEPVSPAHAAQRHARFGAPGRYRIAGEPYSRPDFVQRPAMRWALRDRDHLLRLSLLREHSNDAVMGKYMSGPDGADFARHNGTPHFDTWRTPKHWFTLKGSTIQWTRDADKFWDQMDAKAAAMPGAERARALNPYMRSLLWKSDPLAKVEDGDLIRLRDRIYLTDPEAAQRVGPLFQDIERGGVRAFEAAVTDGFMADVVGFQDGKILVQPLERFDGSRSLRPKGEPVLVDAKGADYYERGRVRRTRVGARGAIVAWAGPMTHAEWRVLRKAEDGMPEARSMRYEDKSPFVHLAPPARPTSESFDYALSDLPADVRAQAVASTVKRGVPTPRFEPDEAVGTSAGPPPGGSRGPEVEPAPRVEPAAELPPEAPPIQNAKERIEPEIAAARRRIRRARREVARIHDELGPYSPEFDAGLNARSQQVADAADALADIQAVRAAQKGIEASLGTALEEARTALAPVMREVEDAEASMRAPSPQPFSQAHVSTAATPARRKFNAAMRATGERFGMGSLSPAIEKIHEAVAEAVARVTGKPADEYFAAQVVRKAGTGTFNPKDIDALRHDPIEQARVARDAARKAALDTQQPIPDGGSPGYEGEAHAYDTALRVLEDGGTGADAKAALQALDAKLAKASGPWAEGARAGVRGALSKVEGGNPQRAMAILWGNAVAKSEEALGHNRRQLWQGVAQMRWGASPSAGIAPTGADTVSDLISDVTRRKQQYGYRPLPEEAQAFDHAAGPMLTEARASREAYYAEPPQSFPSNPVSPHAFGDQSGGAVRTDMSLAEVEHVIQYARQEHLWIGDAEGRGILVGFPDKTRALGKNPDSTCHLSVEETAKLRALSASGVQLVLTHNHPGSGPNNLIPPSQEDIFVAKTLDLAELRVAGGYGHPGWSIKRPKGGWTDAHILEYSKAADDAKYTGGVVGDRVELLGLSARGVPPDALEDAVAAYQKRLRLKQATPEDTTLASVGFLVRSRVYTETLLERINVRIPELAPQRIAGRVDERVAAVVPGGTLLRPGTASDPGLAPGGTPEERAARILDGGVASGTARGWTPQVVQGGGNKVPTPDEAHAAYLKATEGAQRRLIGATDRAETAMEAGGGRKSYEQIMDEANDVYQRETAEAAEAYERALVERPGPREVSDPGLSSGISVDDILRMTAELDAPKTKREPAPVFYSPLRRAAEALKQDKFAADQLRSVLKSSPGVKAEELEVVGLERFLAENPKPTRAALVKWLEENAYQLEEVRLEAPNASRLTQKWRDEFDELQEVEDDRWTAYQAASDEAHNGGWATEGGSRQDALDREAAAMEEYNAARQARLNHELNRPSDTTQNPNTRPRYKGYANPGGKDYVEILIKHPDFDAKAVADFQADFVRRHDAASSRFRAEALAYLEAHNDDFGAVEAYDYGEGRGVGRGWSGIPEDTRTAILNDLVESARNGEPQAQWAYGLPAATELRALAREQRRGTRQVSGTTSAWESSHFGGQNERLLAHTRGQVFKLDDTTRTFHVEEFQSDLHQAGRDEGYAAPMPTAAEKAAAEERVNEAYRALADGDERPLHDYEAGRAYLKAEDELEGITRRMTYRDTERPDARVAHKGDKVWGNLLAKRMLREAAVRDVDGISWSTGAQQIDRYSQEIRQNVDSVSWRPVEDSFGQVEIVARKDGRVVFERAYPADDPELRRLFGRDIADKVEASPSGELSGTDLSVGGHGMKKMYDELQVQNFTALGKKYGVRPTKSKIITEDGPVEVWYMPITDEMRADAIYEGFPLFHRQGSDVKGSVAFKNGQAYLNFFETGDLETLLHEPAHVLRSMLPPETLAAVEKRYGVVDGTWLRHHEERFADDVLTWVHNPSHAIDKATHDAITQVAQVLREVEGKLPTTSSPAAKEMLDKLLVDTPHTKPEAMLPGHGTKEELGRGSLMLDERDRLAARGVVEAKVEDTFAAMMRWLAPHRDMVEAPFTEAYKRVMRDADHDFGAFGGALTQLAKNRAPVDDLFESVAPGVDAALDSGVLPELRDALALSYIDKTKIALTVEDMEDLRAAVKSGRGSLSDRMSALKDTSEVVLGRHRHAPADALRDDYHAGVLYSYGAGTAAAQHKALRNSIGIGGVLSPEDAKYAAEWLTGSHRSVHGRNLVLNVFVDPFADNADLKTALHMRREQISPFTAVDLAGGSKGTTGVGRLDVLDNSQVFIPRAMRQRMIDQAAAVLESANPTPTQQIFLRYWKQGLTQGVFIARPRYYWNNVFGDFTQMASVGGFDVAAAQTARNAAQNFLAVPGVTNAARLADKVAGRTPGTTVKNISDMMAFGHINKGVNAVMDGTDEVLTLGGRPYKAKDLWQVAGRGGVLDTFNTQELQASLAEIMRPRGAVGKFLDANREAVQDAAQLISIRQRVGFYLTLVDAGKTPEDAAQLVVDALYDYRHSLHPWERSFIMQLLHPFWAFEKNNSRRVMRAMLSPGTWAPYAARRVYQTHVIQRDTAALVTAAFDSRDEYGFDRGSIAEDDAARAEEMRAAGATEEQIAAAMSLPRYDAAVKNMDPRELKERIRNDDVPSELLGLTYLYWADDPLLTLLPAHLRDRYIAYLPIARAAATADWLRRGEGLQEAAGDDWFGVVAPDDANTAGLALPMGMLAFLVNGGIAAASGDPAAGERTAEAGLKVIGDPQTNPLVILAADTLDVEVDAMPHTLSPELGRLLLSVPGIGPRFISPVERLGQAASGNSAEVSATGYRLSASTKAWLDATGLSSVLLAVDSGAGLLGAGQPGKAPPGLQSTAHAAEAFVGLKSQAISGTAAAERFESEAKRRVSRAKGDIPKDETILTGHTPYQTRAIARVTEQSRLADLAPEERAKVIAGVHARLAEGALIFGDETTLRALLVEGGADPSMVDMLSRDEVRDMSKEVTAPEKADATR